MNFVCPGCQSTEIEVVMIDCTVSETVKFKADGETEYGIPEIHESINSHYQCKNCGWKIPVEPNIVDDNALEEWLKKQPYNAVGQKPVLPSGSKTMKQEDAQAVANYIGHALGKTGINIKLCISRLEHYTHGISPADLDKFIRTAFGYNQESSAKAENYLTGILLRHGVDNPLIWWRDRTDSSKTLIAK